MPITYDQWMELTKLGLTKPRPDSLQKLDQALKNYWKSQTRVNLHHLCDAFDVWKQAQPDWKTCERNQKGAVTALEEMLPGTDANKAKLDALTPMQFVLEEQKKYLDSVFRGRRLVTKTHIWGSAKKVYDVQEDLQNVARGASILGGKMNVGFEAMVRNVLASFFGDFHLSWEGVIVNEVANCLGHTVAHEIVKSLVPYAGLLLSGANAMSQFAHLGVSAYRHHEVKECREAVRKGDPRAAITAMQQVLMRDISSRAKRGTRAAFEGVSRAVATTFAGPAAEVVVAGVFSIGKLMYEIYEVGSDFIEKYQANSVLSGSDPVTYTVFDKYPLLGCYYIVCADTSNVVNFMLADMGTPGRDWQKEVETLNRNIQPVFSIARKLIDDARVEIQGMPKLKMNIPKAELKAAHEAFKTKQLADLTMKLMADREKAQKMAR